MPIQEETPGQTQDTLERLYLSAGWGTSWCPPRGVGGNVWGKEHLDLPAQAVAPATQSWNSRRKRNETKQCFFGSTNLFKDFGCGRASVWFQSYIVNQRQVIKEE